MADKEMYFDTSSADNLGSLTLEPDESVATPSSVKDKYAFKDAVTRDVLIGTMPLIPAANTKIDPKYEGHVNNVYKIPEGYHDGKGTVYTGDLSEYTPGTAKPEDVSASKTFWVNGKKYSGTLDVKQATQEADATPWDIISPKTAWVKGKLVTGVIPSLPRKDQNLLAGESYTFPYGFSAGTTVISAADLASQTVGNAKANQIIKGQIAWVNGEKVTGTFDLVENTKEYLKETNATQNQVLSSKKFYSSVYGEIRSGTMPDHSNDPIRTLLNGATFTIPEGYYSGRTSIKVQTLHDATIANAVPDNILINKTAWVNGEKVTGAMPMIDSKIVELGAGESFDILKGFHTGTGKVKAKDLSGETIGTAEAGDLLEGKSMWVNGKKIVGTMPDIAASTTDLKPGSTYYIPEGHHSGNGSVTVKSLAYYTPANAAAADILTTKNAWVNGVKVEGTMANNGAVSSTLAAGASYTVPKGYHNGSGVIKAQDLASQTSANAAADDILSPKTAWVNGKKITGTLAIDGSASQDDVIAGKTFYNNDPKTKRTGTLTLTGNATESDVVSGVTYYTTDPKRKHTGSLTLNGTADPKYVLSGYTFYKNNPKTKVTGTMKNNGGVSASLDANQSFTIPEGYHDGSGRITANGLGDQTSGTATAGDIAKGSTAWVNGVKVTGTLELTGTATPEQVVAGATFYSNNLKQKIVGTMIQVPTKLVSLKAGESYTIPAGYYDGTSKVFAVDLASQTQATAKVENILEGYTAWVNGKKITGTMLNQGSTSFRDLAAGTSMKIPEGYYSGYGYITTLDLATQTQSNATADDILVDKDAWVNGNHVNGAMPNNGSWSQNNVNAGTSVTIPKGYHNGSGKITTKTLSAQTPGTAIPYNLLIAKTAWVNGNKITGTMPDNTGWSSKEMVAGSSATIPAGFHDGTGVITAKDLASQTQATAGAGDILAPKTAWVNGSKIVGNIPTYTTSKLRIAAGYDTILPAGYYANPIHIYSLYGDDVLDLTGTSAEYEQPTESLLPNDDGYIDEATTRLVITADLIGG